MRSPGQIVLIACYELGHQPLSVAWPAAVLHARGYPADTIDVSREGLDPARLRRARLVAIAVPMHTALRIGLEVARRLREANPAAHVCFYGLYAALNVELLLAGPADSVIAGEVEAPLAELAAAIEAGDGRPVPGVARRGQPAAPRLGRGPLPVPRRDGLPPLARYARLVRGGRQELTGHAEATRGCRHLCRHCPIPPVYGGRFVAVPVDVVLADVGQQVAAGARHISFGDPDFLNGPGQALRVARGLRAAHPGVSFDFTAKIEHLLRHRALLPELAACGAIFVVSAAESLSDTVLAHLDKGHRAADVAAALEVTRAAGLALRPTWVPFTPWTTLADYRALLAFVAEQDLVEQVDPVQYGLRLLVPPGSLLADYPPMRPHLVRLDPADLSWTWHHPDPAMDELQAAVAALVAEAADRGEEPAQVHRQVAARAGLEAAAPAGGAARPRPPYLTEPWFC
jgi:radical SAM superfamily enzyme YgiQ (UPF0313 family)